MTTTIEDYAAEIIDSLLATHAQESDKSAKPLAAMLMEHGDVTASKGSFNLDYTALIVWDKRGWLVEANNAWTRVYDPADADYDYRAELGIAD